MTDNKLKDFAVSVLSKYISKEDLDTFIEKDTVELEKIKGDDSSSSISYEFYLETVRRHSDQKENPNVFVIKASKMKSHGHDFSIERAINTHTLKIHSNKIFEEDPSVGTQKSLAKKNAKTQKTVKKEIKEFLKNFRKHYVLHYKINDCWEV